MTRDDSGKLPALFCFASAAATFASFAIPWWDDQGGLSVATHWPKAVLLGGIVMFAAGLLDYVTPDHGRAHTILIGSAIAFIVAGVVGFYLRVDNSISFAEIPFTRHVREGFLVPGLALILILPRLAIRLRERAATSGVPVTNSWEWKAPSAVAYVAGMSTLFFLVLASLHLDSRA